MSEGVKFLFALAVFAAFWVIMALILWLVPQGAMNWAGIVFVVILLVLTPFGLIGSLRKAFKDPPRKAHRR